RGRDVLQSDGRLLRSSDYVTITRRPRRIIVAGDNDTPELLQSACEGAQVLVHEATYTQKVADHVGPVPQHSSAARVAKFAETTSIPHLLLTHFSSRYQIAHSSAPLIEEISDEAKQYYRGNLH